MPAQQPDATYVSGLLSRQEALQAEAQSVIEELDLTRTLARVGEVQQVGSSVTGLMVWRDLDFTVMAPGLSQQEAFNVVLPLISDGRMVKVEYANELGERSPTRLPEDQRHYFVLHFLAAEGREWKIDITMWYTNAPRTQLAHIEYIKSRLTDETRTAILWLKDVWHRLPIYPYQVGGMEVYDAVLEHGVRTPAEFDTYLRERGLPGRFSCE